MHLRVSAALGLLAAFGFHPPSDARTIVGIGQDRPAGRMVITYDDGHRVFVGLCGDETAFDPPRRSADGRTIGWAAPGPGDNEGRASTLVLYRDEHIVSRIETDAPIGEWGFYGHGRWVGVSEPSRTAGQPATCATYDARTGNATWTMSSAARTRNPCAVPFRMLGARDRR